MVWLLLRVLEVFEDGGVMKTLQLMAHGDHWDLFLSNHSSECRDRDSDTVSTFLVGEQSVFSGSVVFGHRLSLCSFGYLAINASQRIRFCDFPVLWLSSASQRHTSMGHRKYLEAVLGFGFGIGGQ